MKEWVKEHILVVVCAIVILIVLGIYFVNPVEEQEQTISALETETSKVIPKLEEEKMEPKKIMADVKGAIKNPGVYEAKEGERVIDIIERAGGVIETADKTKVNFAMYIEDEMVLYIPEIGESDQPDLDEALTGQKEATVNINKAEQSELETLPGIGPSKSLAIIEYRESNGPFKTTEDLLSVSGFGEKTFEKLKDKISVK